MTAYEVIIKKQDEKLRELMDKKEYIKFTTEIAKEAFRQEVDSWPESELKDFTLANFDEITSITDSLE